MNGNKTMALGLALVLSIGGGLTAEAQQSSIRRTVRQRVEGGQAAGLDTLSQRARLYNLDLTQDTRGASWMRTVYRQIDLSREANAPLYYPTKTTEQSQNLFAQIFRLVASDRVKVYEYLDGEELFVPEYKVQFKDLLDRFRINYTEQRAGGGVNYLVTDADIPASEVKAYYLKETWYFDAPTSTYDVKIEALCPILYDLGDYGEVPMPLFWLPYEEIKPFITAKPVMLSNYNNSPNATLDDFFRLNMYDGEIIKTKNLLGRALTQYISSPDSLQAERQRIEGQLRDFKKNLFVTCHDTQTDSVSSSIPAVVSKSIKGTNSRDKRVRGTKVSTQTKATKVKAPKVAKAKPTTSGSRSVRGRI